MHFYGIVFSQAMSVETFFSCPAPQSDVVGTCDEQCDGATGCQRGQKCCSNGCGHACTSGLLPIPYIAPQQGAQSPFCEGVRQQATSKGLLGAFVPQCDGAGNFLTLQCHESFCWCVNPENGQPTSDMASGSGVGALPCSGMLWRDVVCVCVCVRVWVCTPVHEVLLFSTGCQYRGKMYANKEMFDFDQCGGYWLGFAADMHLSVSSLPLFTCTPPPSLPPSLPPARVSSSTWCVQPACVTTQQAPVTVLLGQPPQCSNKMVP